jgi:tetratricopeptide (TPR) repeat protein
MKMNPFPIAGFSLCMLLLPAVVGQASAADCLAIRKQIEEQTDILQRKDLAQQGIVDCPNDPIINFEYAYAMERLRKYKLALKHYQIAAKLAPKYAMSYFGMGDAYINLDMPGDAVKAYQTGLSLDPANKRAQNSLAEAKALAKKQGADNDDIPAFTNPLAEPKAAPAVAQKTAAPPQEATPQPYEPTLSLIMQEPEPVKAITANPLQGEALQSIHLDKAGHSDITGSLDDSQMGAD